MNGKDERLTPLCQDPAPLRSKIVAALRRAIQAGILPPGGRLIERELCEKLGVSRTSLREGLRELEADGLLCRLKSRGLGVSPMSAEDPANALRIATMMEALVAEQFQDRADDLDRRRVAASGRALKAAYVAGRSEDILAAKLAFYAVLCTAARNDLALDMMTRLIKRMPFVLEPAGIRERIEAVDRLLEALRRQTLPARQPIRDADRIHHGSAPGRAALGSGS